MKRRRWTGGIPLAAWLAVLGMLTLLPRTGAPGLFFHLEATGNAAAEAAEVPVTGIETDTENILLAVGSEWRIHFTVHPENASDKTILWTSGNPGVAEVDGEGNIVGLKTGNCEIYGNTADGSKKGLRIRVSVREYETVIREPAGLQVDFETTDSIRGTVSYLGSRRIDDYLEIGVTWKTGCAGSLRNGWLLPRKPGEDLATVVVKKNGGKVVSREMHSVYVAQSAIGPESGSGRQEADALRPRPFPELGWETRLEDAEKKLKEKGEHAVLHGMKREAALIWEKPVAALGGKTRPELYFSGDGNNRETGDYRLYRVRCRFYKKENQVAQVKSSLIRAYGNPYHDSAGKEGLYAESNWYLDNMHITLWDLTEKSFLVEWLWNSR